MGTYIPPQVGESELSRKLAAAGLTRMHQGKVRDTWTIPDEEDLLLVVATDRVSVFDLVLGCLIEGKGEILTMLTVFWLTEVLPLSIDHHLVSYGSMIDGYLPLSLREDPLLRARALVVKKLDMVTLECIARGYLTGTALRAYQKTGEVYGHQLPEGLSDGAKLSTPIFTPTTKASEGHDQPLDYKEVRKTYGFGLEQLTLEFYGIISEYAQERGIIIADTKFEFGRRPGSLGPLVFADELVTPDSSRLWLFEDWRQAQELQKAPSGYDKQPLRDWAMKERVDTLDPVTASQVEVPFSLRVLTAQRFHFVFEKLVGTTLASYKRDAMGI